MAVPYTFADTTLSGLNLNLAHLDADFAYLSGLISTDPQFNSIGVGQAASGVTGNINATGTISDGVGTLRPMVVVQTIPGGNQPALTFTGIPAWARRITVNFGDISTNGTSNLIIQFGTSGGFLTSGYYSVASDGVASTKITNAYAVTTAVSNLGSNNGSITFNFCSDVPASANSGFWMQSGVITNSNATNKVTSNAGSCYFASPVTQVKITTVNGTDIFNVGLVGLTYE